MIISYDHIYDHMIYDSVTHWPTFPNCTFDYQVEHWHHSVAKASQLVGEVAAFNITVQTQLLLPRLHQVPDPAVILFVKLLHLTFWRTTTRVH